MERGAEAESVNFVDNEIDRICMRLRQLDPLKLNLWDFLRFFVFPFVFTKSSEVNSPFMHKIYTANWYK